MYLDDGEFFRRTGGLSPLLLAAIAVVAVAGCWQAPVFNYLALGEVNAQQLGIGTPLAQCVYYCRRVADRPECGGWPALYQLYRADYPAYAAADGDYRSPDIITRLCIIRRRQSVAGGFMLTADFIQCRNSDRRGDCNHRRTGLYLSADPHRGRTPLMENLFDVSDPHRPPSYLWMLRNFGGQQIHLLGPERLRQEALLGRTGGMLCVMRAATATAVRIKIDPQRQQARSMRYLTQTTDCVPVMTQYFRHLQLYMPAVQENTQLILSAARRFSAGNCYCRVCWTQLSGGEMGKAGENSGDISAIMGQRMTWSGKYLLLDEPRNHWILPSRRC